MSSYDDLGSFIFNPLGFAIAGPVGSAIGVTTTLVGSAAIASAALFAGAATPSIRTLRIDDG